MSWLMPVKDGAVFGERIRGMRVSALLRIKELEKKVPLWKMPIHDQVFVEVKKANICIFNRWASTDR